MLASGEKFKMVANVDWSVHNPDVEYGGFGYDDVENITDFGDMFAKGENSNIVVMQSCIIAIKVSIIGNIVNFTFKATMVG